MRLFWKIFAAVFSVFFVTFLISSYIETNNRIQYAKECIIKGNSIIGELITHEAEEGYIESKWPFDSLIRLTEKEDFLFWWIVDENGAIYLADNSSFVKTNTYDYFPIKPKENIFLNESQGYGIIIHPLNIGEKWTFWLGFSLKEISELKKQIILMDLIKVISISLIFAIVLYILMNNLTKPLKELIIATKKLKRGKLSDKTEIKTGDEIGELAKAFNDMRLGLKDRNDLLNSLLKTFKGKFGKVATILVRKNIQELAERNPRIKKILPKELGKSIKGRNKTNG